MTDRPLRISVYQPPSSERSPPVTLETTAGELVTSLVDTPLECVSKSDAPAWSPITYSGTTRRASDAVAVCALVYDLDTPAAVDWASLESALEAREWIYAIHGTHTAGRARLVIPTAADIPPRDYRGAWEACARDLGIWGAIDQACSDLARLFYSPSCPPGESAARGGGQSGGQHLYQPPAPAAPLALARAAMPAESRRGEGASPENFGPKIFDLEALRREISDLSTSPHKGSLLALLDGTLRLPVGQREHILHPTASALAYMRHAPPEGVASELFRRVLVARENATPENVESWLTKALYSYRRAAERKADKDAQDAQVERFFRNDDWKASLKFLTDSKGAVKGLKPLEANILTVLRHDEAWAGHVRWNVLKQRIEVTGGHLDTLHSNARESLDVPAAAWFQTSAYNCDVSRDTVGACLQHVALENPYDPVREYLAGLPAWDGVKRIDDALLRYAHASGDPAWVRIISRKFFISAIARPLQPGCQVDTVLVLQGSQGGGKTSFVRALGRGFHVETSLDLHSKDAVMTATSNWLVELGELASLRKSDIESTRNFITRKEDQIRLPYGRTVRTIPRRCVFIGTTNSRQPLTDPEGNRRFWPVSVGAVDITALERDRDQLWAEAREAFLAGESWWLDPAQARRAASEAAVYEADDVLRQEILTWLLNLKDESWPDFLTSSIVAAKVLGKSPALLTPQEVANINRTLAKFRWERTRKRVRGAPSWGFTVPTREKLEAVLAREYSVDNITDESEAA